MGLLAELEKLGIKLTDKGDGDEPPAGDSTPPPTTTAVEPPPTTTPPTNDATAPADGGVDPRDARIEALEAQIAANNASIAEGNEAIKLLAQRPNHAPAPAQEAPKMPSLLNEDGVIDRIRIEVNDGGLPDNFVWRNPDAWDGSLANVR